MSRRVPRLICGVLITSQMLTGCTSWQVVPVSPRALVDSAHAETIQVPRRGEPSTSSTLPLSLAIR